jgi:hypothetical protein
MNKLSSAFRAGGLPIDQLLTDLLKPERINDCYDRRRNENQAGCGVRIAAPGKPDQLDPSAEVPLAYRPAR